MFRYVRAVVRQPFNARYRAVASLANIRTAQRQVSGALADARTRGVEPTKACNSSPSGE
ncbi:MAG: hypothetical protein M3122_09350 [Actinomycetota bacterium]|nr:hypothetical protein [Actinomycetota bacterium]